MIPTLAYAAPFFFLPAMYKMAGSVFQNLTGMMNNKGKGVFDRVSGGLKGKADAGKKVRDENRLRQAQIRAGQGQATPLDRWRLGAFGGVRGGTREAYRRERTRQQIQGINVGAEQSRIDGGSALDDARKRERKQNVEAAAAHLENTNPNAWRSPTPGQLAAMASGAQDEHELEAIIGRMLEFRDEDGLRTLRATLSARAADDPTRQTLERVMSQREWGEALRERAPELTRGADPNTGGSHAGSWNNITAEGLTRLSAESIRQFFAAQQAELVSGDAARITAANDRIANMQAALQAAAESDTHRANLRAEQTTELRAGLTAVGAPPAAAGVGWIFNPVTNRYEKT